MENITPLHQIEAEIEEIYDFLSQHIGEDADIAVKYGSYALSYYARATRLFADAEYHLARVKKSEIIALIKSIQHEKISAPIQSKLANDVCAEEQNIVSKASGIINALKQAIEFSRTVISKAKTEMQYLSSNNNN